MDAKAFLVVEIGLTWPLDQQNALNHTDDTVFAVVSRMREMPTIEVKDSEVLREAMGVEDVVENVLFWRMFRRAVDFLIDMVPHFRLGHVPATTKFDCPGMKAMWAETVLGVFLAKYGLS